MWLYFKAIKEAHKCFEENKGPNDYYTAEIGIGYALTHHPMFLFETLIEAIVIMALIAHF